MLRSAYVMCGDNCTIFVPCVARQHFYVAHPFRFSPTQLLLQILLLMKHYISYCVSTKQYCFAFIFRFQATSAHYTSYVLNLPTFLFHSHSKLSFARCKQYFNYYTVKIPINHRTVEIVKTVDRAPISRYSQPLSLCEQS